MEPIYEYVKGKGWIACQGVIYESGTLFVLERRIPNTWDYYLAAAKTLEYSISDVIKHYKVGDLVIYTNRYPEERDPEIYDYFTLVPL